MAIYEIESERIRRLSETSFSALGFKERGDLQRLLRGQIDVIAPDTLIVAEEFGEWEDSKRRIDLLAVDKEANLVVIELKRSDDGGHMELQAIRYAAMVSTMTFEKVVEVFGKHIQRIGSTVDAQDSLLEFLGWDEPEEGQFAQNVRIILVSADFSRELTTAVMWLNERNLDIKCVRIKPYSDNGRILIDVQQVIPLPEAAEYQVQIREKEQREREDNTGRRTLRKKFWQGLLAYAATRTALHSNLSPVETSWIGAGSGIRGLGWNYVVLQHHGRVELYIDRGSGETETNKRIYDGFLTHRETIEQSFGGVLQWDRLDDRQACRISHPTMAGGYRDDESRWPEVFEAMVEAMMRLEKALSPFIAKLRTGM